VLRQYDRLRPSERYAWRDSAINISTSGLTPGTKYLGSVVYGGAASMPDPTIVRVNP
jgi:hypothetical protein